MKNRMILLVLTGLLVLALGSSVFAFGEKGFSKWQPKEGDMFKHMVQKLELTDAQKDKFQAAMKKEREELKPEMEKMKNLGKQLTEELKKDNPDKAKLYECIKNMGAIRTQMEIKRMDTMLQLRQELTPAQREKFKQMGPDKRKGKPGESGKPGKSKDGPGH
ncbi:MAG: Spy/CpxP family protein refolding chaperone [Candidatus Saganbacteria bacterium]|nr:Spy/CpxP family protein refolding chaperone [Candidatus Saganbacteria bacterium]